MSSPKLFLSYADEDRIRAVRIRDDLKAVGYEVLTIHEHPSFSRKEADYLSTIQQCTHFLLIGSSHVLASNIIIDQLRIAAESNRQVIVLMFEQVDIDSATIDFRYYMGIVERQYVDFSDNYDTGFKILLQILPRVLREDMDLGRLGRFGQRLSSMSVEQMTYALRTLPNHLREAREFTRLRMILMSPNFMAAKIAIFGSYDLIRDYLLAVKAQSPTFDPVQLLADSVPTEDVQLFLIWQALTQSSHLLDQCLTAGDIVATLHARLAHLLRLFQDTSAQKWELPKPIIISLHVPPDIFDTTLAKILDRQSSTAIVNGCAISADGKIAITASHDGTLTVWDTHAGSERLLLKGHKSPVGDCAISANGKIVVSASYDGTLKIWETETWGQIQTLVGHSGRVNGCAISADGMSVVSASHDGRVVVWDSKTGSVKASHNRHSRPVIACDITVDGKQVVSASHDHSLILWDIESDMIKTLVGHSSAVNSCSISQDGSYVVSTSWDGTLKVWASTTGEVLKTLIGHRAFVTDCVISADNTFVISASEDRTIKAWNLEVGNCVSTLYLDGPLSACAMSLTSDDLVVVGNFGVYFLQFMR